MSFTLSEYLLGDFGIDHVDPLLLGLAADEQVRFARSARVYFHLVLAGQLALQAEGAERATDMQPGDFAILLYGTPHSIGAAGMKRARKVHVIESWTSADEPATALRETTAAPLRLLSGTLWLGWTPRNAPVTRALPLLLCDARREREGAAPELARIESACRGPGASAYVHALVQLHLVQVLRQVHDDLRSEIELQIGSAEIGRMAAVVRKVRANPQRPWTVAMLAREVGYSRSSFAAKFKAHTGLGPISFVARTRLAQAAALLKSQRDLPLWDIARRVGYDTQGSFTRAFKAQFGVSPRGYLQQASAAGRTQQARTMKIT